MNSHSYIPRKAKITAKKTLSPDTVSFSLQLIDKKPFSWHPGQFVMLSVLGFGEIPIGITTAPGSKREFEVAVRATGMVSNKICSLSVGEELGINGPFGNGFPLSAIKNKDVVIISGGVGLAPLRSLIQFVRENPKFVKSLKIALGAKTPEYLIYRDEYPDWKKIATLFTIVDKADTDWEGSVGMITKLYPKVAVKPGSVIISCAPPVVYQSIANFFAGKRISDTDLYFLFERRMKCGIGKCQHCTCGEYYVCLDGPVFNFQQLKYNQEAFK